MTSCIDLIILHGRYTIYYKITYSQALYQKIYFVSACTKSLLLFVNHT